MSKIEIWNNDVCDIFNKLQLEDPDEIEDVLWERAYIKMGEEKKAKVYDKLNIDLDHQLIAVGNLERWNGTRCAYKDTETENISDALDIVMGSYKGDNSFSIYVEDGKLFVSQLGHDNPTNPSIMEIRMLRDYETFDDLLDDFSDDFNNLVANSVSVGERITNLYN